MKYILVWTREDGSIHVLGTPNGNAFGSFDAAKDGRGRMVARGADSQDISVLAIEGVPNL